MKIIDTKFDLGQIVFIKTDKEQQPRMIIGITVRPTGLLYELNFGSNSSWHFEIEISDEKDILLTTTG